MLRLPAFLAILLLAGCTSVPLATNNALVDEAYLFDADDRITVSLAAQPEVVITPEELVRFERTVAERIGRAAARTNADGQPRAWQLLVLVSRYDHGDANKRRMRAGMGAMYIDTQVTLRDDTGTDVAEFAANRNYAWGGEMGGRATIADLEEMYGDYLGRGLSSRDVTPVAKSRRMAPATAAAKPVEERVDAPVENGAAVAAEEPAAEVVEESGAAVGATAPPTESSVDMGGTTVGGGAVAPTSSEPRWRIVPRGNSAQKHAPIR